MKLLLIAVGCDPGVPLTSEHGTYKTVKALAFRYTSLKRFKLSPLHSEADPCTGNNLHGAT